MMMLAAGLLAFAWWLAIHNFWLSWIRPLLYRRKHGSLDGYRFVSGIPLIGSIFAILAVVSHSGSGLVIVLAILSQLIDTGGILWLVVSLVNTGVPRAKS